MNWIICPVRNGIAYTQKAMPTFLNQDIGDVRVLLIDNSSTDGTFQWAEPLKYVSVWHQNPPCSVARSWNKAIGLILRNNPYVLVVNNDVLLRLDTYRQLVEDGGQFVTATGSDDPKCVDWPYSDPDPAKKRPHPDFSCYLIRRECWETVGPFDEQFEGAYAEDSQYHVRMHRAGIRGESLEMAFYHAASGTIKAANAEDAQRISKCADANRRLFKEQFGCFPGTKEYEDLFSESSFGMNKRMASLAEPL